MNSSAPSTADAFLRTPCCVRRCAELVAPKHLLCLKHEAMIPDDLRDQLDAVTQAFIEAAAEDAPVAARRALEAFLMTDRAIRLAIEAKETCHD